MVSLNELVSGFKKLGLKPGDTVMVHSSYKSFGGVEGGPQTVIDALLTVLTPEGTLLMPAFTLSFCEQFNETGKGLFDLNNSPSENVGILAEFLRKMPATKRSADPIHSVSAYGKLADELTTITDKSTFGKDSVYGKLHRLNAWIMSLGVNYTSGGNFVHYVEELLGVDYRYYKDFSGEIVIDGEKHLDTFTYYVRDRERNLKTNVEPLGKILEEKGLVNITKIGKSTIKMFRTQDIFRIETEEIKKNPLFMFQDSSGSE